MKMKSVAIINILLTFIVLIGNFCYQKLGFFFPLKMFCSGTFTLQGLINFWYFLKRKRENVKVPLFLLLGVVFSWGGDATINENFVLGAVIFALGHVFFVIAYFIHMRKDRKDVKLCLIWVILSVAFITFFPLIVFEEEAFRYVCLIYAVIISVMAGKAVSNFLRSPTPFTKVIAICSVLFFASDFMLLLAWFSSVTGWTSNACMALYYPAMCLYSGSIVIFSNEPKVREV